MNSEREAGISAFSASSSSGISCSENSEIEAENALSISGKAPSPARSEEVDLCETNLKGDSARPVCNAIAESVVFTIKKGRLPNPVLKELNEGWTRAGSQVLSSLKIHELARKYSLPNASSFTKFFRDKARLEHSKDRGPSKNCFALGYGRPLVESLRRRIFPEDTNISKEILLSEVNYCIFEIEKIECI